MFLEVHSDNPFDTNCWLIAAEGSDDALEFEIPRRKQCGTEPTRTQADIPGTDVGFFFLRENGTSAMNSYLEIWDEPAWRDYHSSQREAYSSLSEREVPGVF